MLVNGLRSRFATTNQLSPRPDLFRFFGKTALPGVFKLPARQRPDWYRRVEILLHTAKADVFFSADLLVLFGINVDERQVKIALSKGRAAFR